MDKTTGEYDFTRLETVVFGVGKVEALGRELSRRGAKRALIVTGKTLGQSKLLNQVKRAAGNVLTGVFTGAAQHVPSQTVTELVAEARRVGADAMVSFGGGSPIDTVKNAAWQLMSDRAGSRTIDLAGAATTSGSGGEILHIAIPTTLSAGEFTPGGGVTDESTKVKGAEPDEVRSILQGYVAAGGNFIDTADNYQHGESERLIGEFVAPNRNDFVIASKFSRGAVANPALAVLGANRKAMVQSVEDSLRRLKTDRIDLYFVHMDDGVTPMDEIARGLDDLARAGKIVYTGLSNFPAWRIATAVAIADLRGWTPIAALQAEYSLLQRTTERELLPMAQGLGLGVMGWSPLAAGLLTGKYRKGEKGRATDLKSSVLHDNPEKNALVIDTLMAIADEIGSNPGQIAIAWVSAKGVLPVIGPRTRAQLDDNLASANIKLSDDIIRRLDEITAVPLGYPHELNAAAEQRAVMTGNRWDQIDFPTRTVA